MRYCKSTIFQANHNQHVFLHTFLMLFAILQKYDFSSKSQPSSNRFSWRACCLRYCKSTIFQANHNQCRCRCLWWWVVCDTAKVRFFKQITTTLSIYGNLSSCLRYCKSTIFQANHNFIQGWCIVYKVVCDTAKVRFFKQITTFVLTGKRNIRLFAILQKYDFSSKSQPATTTLGCNFCCLRYCKSTIFQANHNP